ncbi:urease accessory UreF family protein [Ramlibacter sp. PS3R-8]|uniref:urease accessory protein UreF n=1 Tax=Ramlibacter sp. PS3R-8 TaxID=3133437 RepID=UPI00309AB2A2
MDRTAGMRMDTMDTTTTITDATLLRLIWLASPALPVGGFSYSEGLEAAVEAGLVHDETSAGDWLVDQLHVALARSDLAVVAAVAANPGRADALDAWVRQTRETSELRLQTEQMGRSLGEWEKSLRNAGVPSATRPTGWQSPVGRVAEGTPALPASYPVAFALAAASSGASPRHIALTFAFGWAENMTQSAIKSVPLGQGSGQRMLARLAADIPAAVDAACALQDDERQAFAPMLAILSAQHETQYSRLFRS